MENDPHTQLSANNILKDYYGFDSFRSPQESIVNDLMTGLDLLVLMPTGGGKSLCYQIPSLLRPGVGIVVSPLIALMEDQVAALKSLGIRAAYYNSSLNSHDARLVLRQLRQCELDLLYIAPERLLSQSFLEHLHESEVALFAIDEAHCISQWGHDFRPEYGALNLLKTEFPRIPIIALTATADSQTKQDIINQLNFIPKEYIASFNRPNIFYRVIVKENPLKQLRLFLKTQIYCAGIIYCSTRAGVEKLANTLQENGYNVRAYHAGMSHDDRRAVQMLFRYDKIDIVVATIAFGMGIDKPNVRFVVHYNLPKSIESYYQETGRAGRDGLPATALLLYDPAESTRLRGLINTLPHQSQKENNNHKLNHMLAFAEASTCRRQILLSYFNEMFKDTCGFCDNCDAPPQTTDVTVDAQKVLSCIFRMQQSYGLTHLIHVLRGKNTAKIRQSAHHKLSTFGIGQDKPDAYWKHIAWQLIHRGFCYQKSSQFNVLRLNAKAKAVLKGDERVFIHLPPKTKPLTPDNKKSNPSNINPLVQTLRQLRKQLADEEDKPPFMIFSDATLDDIVKNKPQSFDELLSIFGIGQYKLNLYGKYILDITKAQEANAADEDCTIT